MATQTSSDSRGVRRVLHSPMRRQTYRNLLYLVVMGPLGTMYFTFLVFGLAVGIGLAIVVIGLPIIVVTLALVVRVAAFERTLVRRLLLIDIPPIAVETETHLWNRSKQLVTDRQTWRSVAYVLSEFVYGTIVCTLIGAIGATVGSFLFAPLYYQQTPVIAYGPLRISDFTLSIIFGWDDLLVGLTTTLQVGVWKIETLPGALLFTGLGIVLFVLSLQLFNSFARMWGRYARRMLTTPQY